MSEPCGKADGHFDIPSFICALCIGALVIFFLIMAKKDEARYAEATLCKAAIEAKADTAVLLAVCR